MRPEKRDSCDEPISEADCQDSHRTVENGIIHKPLQSSPSLIPSKFDESEQNGTHTSEPQVTTPMSELEPSGPKISQSESLVIGTETSESKKQSHVALLVNPIKGIAYVASARREEEIENLGRPARVVDQGARWRRWRDAGEAPFTADRGWSTGGAEIDLDSPARVSVNMM